MYRVIKASDDWGYDPYNGKTYRVSGGYSTTKWTNDPVTAIKYWFMIGQKHSGDTCIQCRTRDAALAICQAATEDLLTTLWNKYRCPYKLEYLVESAQKKVQDGCKWFHESDFGDQVHPFDIG